jgi:nucleoside-diphosphate-sugar epimerase
MSRVLVTGGTGFLGSWCIVKLLAAGHDVATTLRSLGREPDVRDMVQAGGEPHDAPISFYEADLLRDDLHLLAMTSPAAAGERFIAVAGEPLSMLEVAKVLRQELGDAASKVPTQQLPDIAIRTLALTSPQMRQIAPNLGKRRRSSNAKALQVLGWSSRPNEEVVVATAESLLARNLVTKDR